MSLLSRTLGSLLLALAAACSTAYSDGRAPAPSQPLAMDPAMEPSSSPYGVEILGEDGQALATYQAGGRYYVLGEASSRYLIHVSNPTNLRVEAVVTVDGLDVVDGGDGDLRKRGYVVPAGGDLRIEGFRTSTSEVATFRFSSVDASYAGRKGKARNIGVIAVALFAETAPVEIIAPDEPVIYYGEGKKDYGDGYGGESDDRDGDSAAPRRSGGGSDKRGGDQVTSAEDMPSGGGRGAPGRMRPPPPPDHVEESERPPDPDPCCEKSKRPGLGTEYGEQRYSAATWTRFVRASETPTAVAELRYNDAPGLAALGVIVAPTVSPEEITVRETADPFPGDPTFAPPPAGIR